MAIKRSYSDIVRSEQTLLKRSIDDEFEILAVEVLGYDGQNLQRLGADNQQIKVVESGGYRYFCFAAPGTAEAAAGWRIFRLDDIGNLLYADGNANFDNVASSPESLTYSYT